MAITWPVMYSPFVTRNATSWAISSGRPNRPIGIFARILVADIVWHGCDHLGRDEAWRDRVDGHALAGELERRCLREADDASLRRGVVGLTEVAVQADD